MKKLILLLFIPLVFSCSDDSNSTNEVELQIGDLHEGGIVFSVNSLGGKIAAMGDAGIMNYYEAIDSQSNDWYLPSLSELELMYITIGQGADNIGNFADGGYLSSTTVGSSSNPSVSVLNFSNGNSSSGLNPILNFRVRLIRSY